MKQITIFLEGESPTLKLIMGKQQQHHKHIFIFEYFHIYVCRNFTHLCLCAFITNINTLREKCPNTELFLDRIFLHSD